MFREEHKLNRYQTAYQKRKDINEIKEHMAEEGLDATLVEQRLRSRSRSKSLMAIKAKGKDAMVDEDAEDADRAHSRIREASRSRSKGHHRSMSREEIHGKKVTNKLSKVWRTQDKRSESDRFIGVKMPKHLFSGKSSNGKADRR